MKKNARLQNVNSRKMALLFFIFLIAALLLFLDAKTSLYINNTIVHFIISFLAVTTLPIMIAAYFFKRSDGNTILTIMFSALCVCFLNAFLTWNGDWKTQTILYRNIENPSKTIEYQMRGDRFSFGYKKQIVAREKVLPFIDLIVPIDTSKVDLQQWHRSNLVVNEMKIPGEYVDSPCP